MNINVNNIIGGMNWAVDQGPAAKHEAILYTLANGIGFTLDVPTGSNVSLPTYYANHIAQRVVDAVDEVNNQYPINVSALKKMVYKVWTVRAGIASGSEEAMQLIIESNYLKDTTDFKGEITKDTLQGVSLISLYFTNFHSDKD